PDSGDVQSTKSCLGALGFQIEGDQKLQVTSAGWRPQNNASLDAGNSGTTMRLLMGALAGSEGEFEISGDASLSARPMGRVAKPLKKMGARIDLQRKEFPPVRIEGSGLTGIDYALDVPSAQVKSAVLLAGLQAEGRTRVSESQITRDHTERLLGWLGVADAIEPRVTEVSGTAEIPAFEIDIPGDFSAAAFHIAAACLVKGSRVLIHGVGLNPTRIGFLDAIRSMGATVTVTMESEWPEPHGTLEVSSHGLVAFSPDPEVIPTMIDELPLIALIATQAEGVSEIKGAAELRIKETDRIAVLAAGLRKLGAEVEEWPDGIGISGRTPLVGTELDPQGDHRLAMTFALAGLVSKSQVVVRDWECTQVSYPGFERDLARVLS
ncbi:MAG TPA: 3-phosphoshikimate 1-carboxyvinyltransferase, partial [Actinomycetota bacterium]|nr:3-phosphoshikimate 1-carboxyvinyltransferase [Actinomycetota bacterium]